MLYVRAPHRGGSGGGCPARPRGTIQHIDMNILMILINMSIIIMIVIIIILILFIMTMITITILM